MLCLEVHYSSLWGCLALWQPYINLDMFMHCGQVCECAIHLLLYSGVSCVYPLVCSLAEMVFA